MVRSGPLRASLASASTSTLALAQPGNSSPSTLHEKNATHSLGLHRAAGTGNVALVLYALENGQSPNSMLHGVAPLHVAACVGDLVATQLLIAFGADVQLSRARARAAGGPGVEGSTALHFAAANGHYAVVCTLLENGARPAPVDKDGQTPESLASANQHTQCVAVLRQYLDTYGPDGHVEPYSVRELGYTVQWGDAALAPISREGTPDLAVRTPVFSAPLVPHTRRGSPAVPLSVRTDVQDAPQRSSTVSPPLDARRRPSLPYFLEKAAHPASSLRALWPQSTSTAPAIHKVLHEDESPGLRVPRINSRASLSSLLKRATGSAYPRTPEERHTPPLRTDDSETSSRFSGVLSPTALLSLVQRRSQENLSVSSTDASEASPSLSASPVSDSTSSRSTGRTRSDLSRPAARPSEALRSLEGAAPGLLPPVTTRTYRVRSSSASGARLGRTWDERDAAPSAQTTRARASSEVQPVSLGGGEMPMLGTSLGRAEMPVLGASLGRTEARSSQSSTSLWPPPPSESASSRSSPSSGEVVQSILDQGTVLGATPDQGQHSSLAILLAQYGETLHRPPVDKT